MRCLTCVNEEVKVPRYYSCCVLNMLEMRDEDRYNIRRCIQKFPDWPPGARTANGTALPLLRASLVTFSAITLCVASQRVFIVVTVYFVID
jgi:hypothetical protein